MGPRGLLTLLDGPTNVSISSHREDNEHGDDSDSVLKQCQFPFIFFVCLQ